MARRAVAIKKNRTEDECTYGNLYRVNCLLVVGQKPLELQKVIRY
jgi:hypothetical protein